ncbi:MAG: hypothetical protein EAZ30_08005 [Betaproteobacteria bacterium]|nr:MAG: hypothetical protein EAZ30_08005 [Betaproteobacteria bacterium]
MNSLASANSSREVANVSIHRIYSVDQALCVPAISALFDERKQPILQLDYADFEAITRPLQTLARSQMWELTFDLSASVSDSSAHVHGLQNTLASVIATKHEILNTLAVISCNTQASAVQLLRQHQTLLTAFVKPTDMHGLAAVADESASTPRITVLVVTMPKA